MFQEAYINAFQSADYAVLCNVESRSIDANQELMDVGSLATEISKTGVVAHTLQDAKAIEEFLLKEVGTNDLIVVMSNGSFGGLPSALEQQLIARFGR
jgi:UDP-N-acetylmuramate: L-alanyl-gamma-D-glutamyl-meso-diaminopimelate ligase